MDTITIGEMKQLAAHQATHAVSLYLPTHATREAGAQDAIRLKNLVQSAAAQLEARGLSSGDAATLLSAAAKLPDDEDFWQHRSEGLAVLLAPGLFRAYRLPMALRESVTVGQRLNIKPLLAAADLGEHFWLLVLSQTQIKLWKATRAGITELAVKGWPPKNRAALLNEKVAARADVEQFFRVIDHALSPLLRHETAPLLLAGVDYLLPIYRQITRYPHLAERHLTGHCDLLSSQQLHERSWEIMRPYFDRPRRRALDRLRELTGTDRASLDLASIVAAVAGGRVDVLVADPGQDRRGIFNEKLGTAVTCDASCAGSEDLVNLAVAETLLHGGTVFSAESSDLPAQAPAAAIFRY